MVHTYPVGDGFIALDVDTGAVHVLDRPAYEAVRMWENASPQEIAIALAADFGEEEAVTAMEEVRRLVEDGLLFSNLPVSADDVKPEKGDIKALCLHIAHDCDLRCRYCFAGTGSFHGSRSMMSVDIGKRALDFLIERSGERENLEVDFFGGEPMMNFDVVKALVAYGRELESKHGKIFHFTITTNAVALTDDAIDFINAEMNNCVLSLDGRQTVHDFMRPDEHGADTYARALSGAKRLVSRRGGKDYYVRGTFTAKNLDFADDVMAIADEGFEQVSVEPVVLPEASPYALKEEHLPLICEEYDRLMKAYIMRRKDGDWFSFFHFVIDLEGGPCLRKRLTGCGAGYEYLAVTPEGDLYPCHQFVGRAGFRLGSVLDGRLDETLRERFAANHALAKEECGACWAKFHCGGGCAANAHAFSGAIEKPYAMECAMERKRLECALAVIAVESGAVHLRGEMG